MWFPCKMWDISDNSVLFLYYHFAVHTKVSIKAKMIIWISIFIGLFFQIPFRGILTYVLFFSLYLEFVLFAARDFGIWTNAFRSYFNTFSWNFWKLSLLFFRWWISSTIQNITNTPNPGYIYIFMYDRQIN